MKPLFFIVDHLLKYSQHQAQVLLWAVTRSLLLFTMATFITACNLPAEKKQYDFNTVATFAAQTLTAAGTPGNPTSTAESSTPAASATTGTIIAGCNQAQFVEDVSVPDDTTFAVEKPFTKIWKLKNTGTCTWNSNYKVIFESGYRMSAPLEQALSSNTVAPGETVTIAINMIAPALSGTYRGNWQIKAENGETFSLSSGPFWVQIKARKAGILVWPILYQGDTKVEVYALQYLLRHHGFPIAVDGTFGGETANALKNFQAQNDIQEQGAQGDTWEALTLLKTARGDTNNIVRAAQHLLKHKHQYELEIDGIFGPITEAAIKDFQTKQGLTPNGIIDPLTLQKLIKQ